MSFLTIIQPLKTQKLLPDFADIDFFDRVLEDIKCSILYRLMINSNGRLILNIVIFLPCWKKIFISAEELSILFTLG